MLLFLQCNNATHTYTFITEAWLPKKGTIYYLELTQERIKWHLAVLMSNWGKIAFIECDQMGQTQSGRKSTTLGARASPHALPRSVCAPGHPNDGREWERSVCAGHNRSGAA